MKRKWTGLVAAALAVALGVGALGGCAPKGDAGDARFYLWSDDGATPAGFADVLGAFNEGAGREMGVKLQFSFDTQSDYKQNLNLAIASGQNKYDAVFDAAWVYLSEFAKKDYYYELSGYFNSDAYAGLKGAFDAEFLNNNKFNNGVYGVPLTETFSDITVAYLRKDWRVECAADTGWAKPAGISTSAVAAADLADGVDNFDELEYYLYWVKAKKDGVVPALSNNDATWGAWDLINTRILPAKSAQDAVNDGVKTNILVRQGVEASAYIRNGEVRAADIKEFLSPAAAKGASGFPPGFDTPDPKWQGDFLTARRWRDDGIIGADVMGTTDSDAKFKAGLGGAVVQTINNFAAVETQLKANNPGAELEIYVNDPAIREKRNGYAQTDYKAWNFLCIPKTVPQAKADKIMKFLNWLFESRENHDLFQYGIRGRHWDAARDENGAEIEGTVSTAGMEAYAFPAYELTWNQNYIRVQSASDPKVTEYSRYMYDSSRYVSILYSGFTFDPQRTTELSNAVNNATLGSAVTKAQSYRLGQIAGPVEAWNAELSGRHGNVALQGAADVIKDEIIGQLQAYVDGL
ncbi:MAG: hypothetical protein LBL66_04140 [Clostridiales bacterium]|jgi:putative aldouronate transport system substrate-binding protein|nr:hypothetical protein [Clostridiales bacterium]